MASGVQGKMDLTVPVGGWSSTAGGVEFWMVVERREDGLKYRILLSSIRKMSSAFDKGERVCTCGRGCNGI